MKKGVCFLFYLIIILTSDYVDARQAYNSALLKCTISSLEDPKQTISAQSAWALAKNGGFSRAKANGFNFGKTSSRFWLLLQVDNPLSDELVAVISNPFLYHVEWYRVQYDTPKHLYTSGIDSAYNLRPIPGRLFSFPVLAKPRANYLLLVHRKNEVLRFSIDVMPKESFLLGQNNGYLYFGILSGILLIILLMSAILRLAIKDNIYVWYILYVVCMWLFLAADNGFGYELLWPKYPLVQKYIRTFLSVVAMGAQLRFMYLLFGKGAIGQPSGRFITGYLYFTAIVLVLSFISISFGETNMPIGILSHISTFYFISGVCLLTVISAKLALKGLHPAKLYLISIAPAASLITFVILSRMSVIRFHIETAHLYAVTIVFEIIVLAYGLGTRYQFLKEEKDQLQISLISQQKRTLTNFLETQESERSRFAKDLHDDTGGLIAALKNILSGIQPVTDATSNKIQQAQEVANDIGNTLRYIAHNIMPAAFNQTTLFEAIDESVRKANAQQKVYFDFAHFGDIRPLPKEMELNILRMVNELMHNVIKHAGATRSVVQLIYHPQHIEVMVEDNGKGIKYDEGKGNGIGLKNVQARAEFMQANLYFDSNKNGTTIICNIPY